MSSFFMGFGHTFPSGAIFHTMSLEHRKVVGRVRAQEEGCPLENTLPAVGPDPFWSPLSRDKKTASESEAMSGQPTSFEKNFRYIEKVLYTEWVAA